MKAFKAITLFAIFLFALPGISLGQTDGTSQIKEETTASWIIKVQGERRTRTLKVSNVSKKMDGSYELASIYGWTDGELTPVSVTLAVSNDGVKLSFITQSKATISALRNTSGNFEGTFTTQRGETKPLIITKASEADIAAQIVEIAPQKPEANVPASCAGFFGGWAGRWSIDQGPQRLWITQVKADCSAMYSYRGTASNAVPDLFYKAEIKNGSLTVPCGNDGKCVFTKNGDEIWASYQSGSGNNNAVFKKIQ